jgi:hypothetical protein
MTSLSTRGLRQPWLWVASIVATGALAAGSCGGGSINDPCAFDLADLSGTWSGDHTVTDPSGTTVHGTETTSFLEKAGGTDVKGFWTYVRGDTATTLFVDGSCSGRNQDLRTCGLSLGLPTSDVVSLNTTDGCAITGSGTTTANASVINLAMTKQSGPPECPNDVNMELDGVWVGSHEFVGGATGREFVQIDDTSCDQIRGGWVFERNGESVQNDFTGHCANGRGSYVVQVGTETLALTLVPDQCVLTGTGTDTTTGESYTLRMARGNRTVS